MILFCFNGTAENGISLKVKCKWGMLETIKKATLFFPFYFVISTHLIQPLNIKRKPNFVNVSKSLCCVNETTTVVGICFDLILICELFFGVQFLQTPGGFSR